MTSLPTMRVVDGPGGLSVGNKMTMLCPVSCTVDDPSGFCLVTDAAPLDGNETVFPFPEKARADPAPPVMVVTLLLWRTALLPPLPEMSKAKEHAWPAGKFILKGGLARRAADAEPASKAIAPSGTKNASPSVRNSRFGMKVASFFHAYTGGPSRRNRPLTPTSGRIVTAVLS